jgi:hypothetical protein
MSPETPLSTRQTPDHAAPRSLIAGDASAPGACNRDPADRRGEAAARSVYRHRYARRRRRTPRPRAASRGSSRYVQTTSRARRTGRHREGGVGPGGGRTANCSTSSRNRSVPAVGSQELANEAPGPFACEGTVGRDRLDELSLVLLERFGRADDAARHLEEVVEVERSSLGIGELRQEQGENRALHDRRLDHRSRVEADDGDTLVHRVEESGSRFLPDR